MRSAPNKTMRNNKLERTLYRAELLYINFYEPPHRVTLLFNVNKLVKTIQQFLKRVSSVFRSVNDNFYWLSWLIS